MMRLKTAIKRVEQEFAKAEKLAYIRNPVAYALYQVWKEADLSGDSVRDEERHIQNKLRGMIE